MKLSTRERGILRILALLLCTICAPVAQALVVYDNFGPAMSFDTSRGQGIGSQSNAEYGLLFTTLDSGYVSSLTVAVSSFSGAGDITFSLYDNNSGQPGSILETYGLSNLPDYGSVFTPQTMTASGSTFLDAARSYWLIASQPNFPDTVVWHSSTVSAETLIAFRNSQFTEWVPQLHGEQWALRVELSKVPVPAAVWLFASGLLGLVGMARCKMAV